MTGGGEIEGSLPSWDAGLFVDPAIVFRWKRERYARRAGILIAAWESVQGHFVCIDTRIFGKLAYTSWRRESNPSVNLHITFTTICAEIHMNG